MLADEMREEGYKYIDFESDYTKIDAVIAIQTCPKCGEMMHYEGYVMGNPITSYRAFSECSHCHYYEEF